MKIDHDCPHCKKGITLDTEKMEVLEITKQADNPTIQTNTNQVLEKPKPEIKEVIKTVIEDFKPNYECPDGDCDIGVHKNKNFKKMPKGKCTNCDQFTKHDKGTCPWCKHDEIEPIDSEQLDELGIDTPNIEEHEEHIHE